MILIVSNPDKSYYHIVGPNGEYGVIDHTLEHYRSEHYEDRIDKHSVYDNEYWESNNLYHVGEFDSFKEAFTEMLDEMGLLHPYLARLIREDKFCSAPDGYPTDWLLTPVCCEDPEVDGVIQRHLDECSKMSWSGHSKDCRAEAEYFELYEADEEAAGRCYNRAAYFDFLAENKVDARA